MSKSLLLVAAAVAGAALFPAAPAAAQNERVVTVFGADPCPTSSSGDDIVVCRRRPEGERFRIPEELRTPVASPENESWAARSRNFDQVGRTGTGSCSPVGAGGFTGCTEQMIRQAQEERRAGLGPETPQR